MTTHDQRHQKSKEVCEKLMERIEEVTAAVSFDYWPPVTGPPSAAFMTALGALEIDPSDLNMQRVSDAYHDVLDAWRQAASEYSAERASSP